MAGQAVYHYTPDDLKALQPFLNLLRNKLVEEQDVADTKHRLSGKGGTPAVFTPAVVEKYIRTDPALRALWKRLTPAQRAYSYNRHVRNTPTRYDESVEYNPYGSPLEHDVKAANSPTRYAMNRAAMNAILGTFEPGSISFTRFSQLPKLVGNASNKLYSKILPGYAHSNKGDAVEAGAHALTQMDNGGYGRYATGPHKLVPMPTTKAQRTADKLSRDVGRAVTDALLFTAMPGALPTRVAGAPVVSHTLNAAKVVSNPIDSSLGLVTNIAKNGWKAASKDFAKNVLKRPVKASWRLLKHPFTLKNWKLFGKSLTKSFFGGGDALLEGFGNVDAVREALRDNGRGGSPNSTYAYSVGADKYRERFGTYGGSKDPEVRARIQRYKESMQQPQQPIQPDNKESQFSWASPAIGMGVGGVLGMLMARRYRLLGLLAGGVAGAAIPSLYQYFKNRRSNA